jgi:hypothetical protein
MGPRTVHEECPPRDEDRRVRKLRPQRRHAAGPRADRPVRTQGLHWKAQSGEDEGDDGLSHEL